MSAKLTAVFAFSFGAIIGLVVGCQKYDFEPVSPAAVSQTSNGKTVVAKKFKPNVMLMVDNSGSMYLPTNTTLAACRYPDGGICGTDYSDPTTYCPSSCPTRTSELRRAMADFFADAGTVARFGLTTFPYPAPPGPADSECGTGKVRVDIPQSNDVDAELQAAANAITSTIQNDTIGGGTPTSDTLKMLSNYPLLQSPTTERDNFILLETDGVPNCNANNVNDGCDNPAACACTISTCCGGPSFPYRRLGCLDQTETVNSIANLLSVKQIRTIVVGFGDEAAASTGTLNAMAEAGGFALTCPDGGNGPCGLNNTCNRASGKCVREYYQAANRQELAQALRDIVSQFTQPCDWPLTDTPSDPSLLSVIINGQSTRSGPDTWNYRSGPPPTVTFVGALCDRLRNSTPTSPVTVDIRILRTL